MRRFAVLATVVAGFVACRTSLEDDSFPIDAALSASCQQAQTESSVDFLEEFVFARHCNFSGCHNGQNTDAGMMDLRAGMAHASLVNVASKVNQDYMLVVPGMPNQSYLLMMVQHFEPEEMSPPADPPPADIGLMPQNAGNRPICGPKREALARWIEAGAMP